MVSFQNRAQWCCFLIHLFTNTDSPGCIIASFALLFLSMYVLRSFLYCASLWSTSDRGEMLDLDGNAMLFNSLYPNSISDGGVPVTVCAVVL